MSRPLWNTKPTERRRELARRHMGREVRVVIDHFRQKDGVTTEHVGLLLSVCVGGSADGIVLREPGYWDRWISLATIRSIEPI